MLRNLLEKVNRIWYNKSRIEPTITIEQGTGTHKSITIQSGKLYFHSLPYTRQLTFSQEIVLDDLSINDTIGVIRSMGYKVTVLRDSEAINESALTLLEVTNRPITNPETIYAFTSNLWRIMYPLHRLLVMAGNDVDEAVAQAMLPSAKSEWLDYWAGFFKINRLPDETDELFLRRIYLTMSSVKGNNIAIEELVSYYINAHVSVLDYQPGIFEIRVTPEYMSSVQKIRDLVQTLKGAGISYILNYANQYAESYQASFKSSNGLTFNEINTSFRSASVNFGRMAENYSYIPPERITQGFVLNRSRLNSSQKLSVADKRILEKVSMTMTQNETIIQQL